MDSSEAATSKVCTAPEQPDWSWNVGTPSMRSRSATTFTVAGISVSGVAVPNTTTSTSSADTPARASAWAAARSPRSARPSRRSPVDRSTAR